MGGDDVRHDPLRAYCRTPTLVAWGAGFPGHFLDLDQYPVLCIYRDPRCPRAWDGFFPPVTIARCLPTRHALARWPPRCGCVLCLLVSCAVRGWVCPVPATGPSAPPRVRVGAPPPRGERGTSGLRPAAGSALPSSCPGAARHHRRGLPGASRPLG